MTSLTAAILLAGGCHLMVNPFTDELANQPAVTTPSVEGVRAADTTSSVPAPRGEATEVYAKDGTVTHGPLYFEDSSENEGSEDGLFAWTGEDYLQTVLGQARFLLNTVLFPISAVHTPPWVVMASDGRPSRRVLGMDCDAERWVGER